MTTPAGRLSRRLLAEIKAYYRDTADDTIANVRRLYPTPTREDAIAYARQWGLQFADIHSRHAVGESGKYPVADIDQGIAFLTEGAEADRVLHELGHWQCAAPWRRMYPDLGLRDNLSGYPVPTPKYTAAITRSAEYREEECAAILGCLHMRALGGPWPEDMNDMNFLGFKDNGIPFWDSGDRVVLRTLRTLLRWGLITEHGHPRRRAMRMEDDRPLDLNPFEFWMERVDPRHIRRMKE